LRRAAEEGVSKLEFGNWTGVELDAEARCMLCTGLQFGGALDGGEEEEAEEGEPSESAQGLDSVRN
jgi:hypothetical protein